MNHSGMSFAIQRKKSVIGFGILFCVINLVGGCSHPGNQLARESSTSFLKKEPYRKGKQIVDLSKIENSQDILIVKEAINNVMRLIYILGQTETNWTALKEVTTNSGLTNLKLPPVQNQSNRFMPQVIDNWKIIDNKTLSFDVVFHDVLKKQDAYQSSFVFVKNGQGWQFDRH